LASAPPDLDCLTFLAAPSPLAMWARRQAHETAIHRVDAESPAARSPNLIRLSLLTALTSCCHAL